MRWGDFCWRYLSVSPAALYGRRRRVSTGQFEHLMVYQNVVQDFRVAISVFYIIAMFALCLHSTTGLEHASDAGLGDVDTRRASGQFPGLSRF